MSIKIRNAALSDAFAIAQIHVASWQSAYQGIVPNEHLDKMSVKKRETTWKDIIKNLSKAGQCLFIAEDNGTVIGFASAGPARKSNVKFDGELYAIYADPAYFGQGVGKPLFKKCENYLRDENFNGFYCWVLEDNKRGKDFYKRMGGKTIEDQEGNIEIAGKQLKEIMCGWEI